MIQRLIKVISDVGFGLIGGEAKLQADENHNAKERPIHFCAHFRKNVGQAESQGCRPAIFEIRIG